ncbi:MAG: HAD hydrolase-like protein [Nitriliruptoraceae bacterium]
MVTDSRRAHVHGAADGPQSPWHTDALRWGMFDLDGCLVDSTDAIAGCVNHALITLGLPPRPVGELRRFIGPPLSGAFSTLLAEAGAAPDLRNEAIALYRQRYATASLTETKLVGGITEALRSITSACELRVVTSKPKPFAEPIIAHLGLSPYFVAVHGPKPEDLDEPKSVTLARALAEIGGNHDDIVRQTVMVGDRHHDIDAGRYHGVHTMGVTWGAGDRDELEKAGAGMVVTTPDSMAAAITGQ